MRARTLMRSGGVSAVLLAALSLGACSQNKHVFKSRPYLPTTVQVTDALSGNIIWAMDVPVNEELSLDFDRPYNFELFKNAHEPPTSMTWKLFHVSTGWQLTPYKFGRVDLRGAEPLMRVSFRPAPEYPPGYTPPGVSPSEYKTATQMAATAPESKSTKETNPEKIREESVTAEEPKPATSEPAPETPSMETPSIEAPPTESAPTTTMPTTPPPTELAPLEPPATQPAPMDSKLDL